MGEHRLYRNQILENLFPIHAAEGVERSERLNVHDFELERQNRHVESFLFHRHCLPGILLHGTSQVDASVERHGDFRFRLLQIELRQIEKNPADWIHPHTRSKWAVSGDVNV